MYGDSQETKSSGKGLAKFIRISWIRDHLGYPYSIIFCNLFTLLSLESFEANAFNFKAGSTKLRQRMWWQNFKVR